HVLLPFADQLEEVDATFKQLLTDDKIREIVNAVPDDWLNWTEGQETPQDLRDVYIQFLEERIKHSEIFVNEAQNARKALI
ncbi:aminotransferase class I and II, partial [Bacteroides xylanisolvens]